MIPWRWNLSRWRWISSAPQASLPSPCRLGSFPWQGLRFSVGVAGSWHASQQPVPAGAGADSLCCGLWNHLWSALTLCHHLEKPQLWAKHCGPEGSSAGSPAPLAALQHHFSCTDSLTEISAEQETWRRIKLLRHKCTSVYLFVKQWCAALGRGRDFTCKCEKIDSQILTFKQHPIFWLFESKEILKVPCSSPASHPYSSVRHSWQSHWAAGAPELMPAPISAHPWHQTNNTRPTPLLQTWSCLWGLSFSVLSDSFQIAWKSLCC